MESSAKPGMGHKIATALSRVPGGALLFAVIPLVALGYFGWFYYGAEHLDQALYSLRQENLVVTPQPDWIRSNVAEEVFEDGGLDRISLLDPQSNATIAQAFEAHHWVKSTTRVTKNFGGEVAVDIVYRKPAAMVYFADSSDPAAKQTVHSFYPIDGSAVVLPTTTDFDKSDVLKYFIIFADGARPAGEVGMPFGDARVTDALKLCMFLENARERYGLERIYVDHDPRSGGSSPWLLTITTRDGQRNIVWGHAPGAEARDEPHVEEKLKRMTVWIDKSPAHNSLHPQTLDLRSRGKAEQVSFPAGF